MWPFFSLKMFKSYTQKFESNNKSVTLVSLSPDDEEEIQHAYISKFYFNHETKVFF